MSNSKNDEALSIARARVLPGVTTGDAVLIPPGSLQGIRNAGDGDLVFRALCTPRFRPERYVHLE